MAAKISVLGQMTYVTCHMSHETYFFLHFLLLYNLNFFLSLFFGGVVKLVG